MAEVAFEGPIGGRYYRDNEWVTTTYSETARAIETVFSCKPEWESGSIISRVGEGSGLVVIVDPFKRYVSLSMSPGLQSLNPEPFKDAHLIADDYDVDPYYSFYKRDSYISEHDARQAVWEYINTGNRPTNIQWQGIKYEAYELPPWAEGNPRREQRFVIISPDDPGIDPYHREPDDSEILYGGYGYAPIPPRVDIKEDPF